VGDLTIPSDTLARAGLGAGDDLIVEAAPGHVRVFSDRVRKVYVESTSRCNLDCRMCVRHGWSDPQGHMPVEGFERLVDGIPPADPPVTLTFGGFGEPLVHPEWRRLLALAGERGLRVEFITNGLLLGPDAAREMVERGVGQVTVSFDGGDEESYAWMRGTGAVGALAAVHHLREARRRARHQVTLGVAAVATRTNVASLPKLFEWASDIDLDFLSIGNLLPHTEEMAGEVLWERTGWASVFRPSSWRPQVRLGRFDVEEATRPLAVAMAGRSLVHPSPSVDPAPWRNYCRFAHEGMCAVGWDGRVTPCLSLLHGHDEYVNHQTRRVDAYVVGRVDERPLAEIWRSEEFRGFRRRIREFDFPPCFHCGGCHFTETNQEDCYGNPPPVCGECPWAQGIVLCP
jgi:MoaA/NifB/PqqE/SkfB family radical SAM enzyme